MPLVRCSKDGKSGWKWGKDNTSCFTGPNGKKQAIKQGVAIEGPEKFAAEASEEEVNEAIGNLDIVFITRFALSEAAVKKI